MSLLPPLCGLVSRGKVLWQWFSGKKDKLTMPFDGFHAQNINRRSESLTNIVLQSNRLVKLCGEPLRCAIWKAPRGRDVWNVEVRELLACSLRVACVQNDA